MNAKRWVHASPSFLGFDLGVASAAGGRGACVRAIEEAAAYVARGHRDIITSLTGLSFQDVVFTGGAANGRLWPQIMADVLGVRVHIPVVTESSALGAAIWPASARASMPGMAGLLRRRAGPSNPPRPPRRPTTSTTRPGARSTGACSTSPKTACSTRSGEPPAPRPRFFEGNIDGHR